MGGPGESMESISGGQEALYQPQEMQKNPYKTLQKRGVLKV